MEPCVIADSFALKSNAQLQKPQAARFDMISIFFLSQWDKLLIIHE